MFQFFYPCRVSRPIAASHKREVSAVRGRSASPADIALIIALVSDSIDSTNLTGPAYANLGSTGWCE